jgi:hypothetical protein
MPSVLGVPGVPEKTTPRMLTRIRAEKGIIDNLSFMFLNVG